MKRAHIVVVVLFLVFWWLSYDDFSGFCFPKADVFFEIVNLVLPFLCFLAAQKLSGKIEPGERVESSTRRTSRELELRNRVMKSIRVAKS